MPATSAASAETLNQNEKLLQPVSSLFCSYTSVCAGCDYLLKPYSEQKLIKTNDFLRAWRQVHGLETALPAVGWITIAPGGLRDRADLMIDQRSGQYKLGLFDQFKSGLVDLEGCPQMSPSLEAWFHDFRRFKFPIGRGSVRLRVSPSGVRGIWLDLANIDIKNLLEERSILTALQSLAVVEIGQKRKSLVEREGQLKLGDPELRPWFETYIGDDSRALPLYCSIATFTQPGFAANRALITEAIRLVRKSQTRCVIEFGSGIGNFTLPLAAACDRVKVYEVDGLALNGLRRSATEAGLSDKIEINEGNFQIEKGGRPAADFSGVDLVFVDPPRSGLQSFLKPLEQLPASERPANFVYVSCFAESFATDSAQLFRLGYKISEITIVDQFPQSRHFELVALFCR